MYRLTARVLLVLLLVSIFAPAALAVSAPPPHACCMRKPLHDHGSRSLDVRMVGGGHRSCCPPVTTAHWADLGLRVSTSVRLLSVNLDRDVAPVLRSNDENSLQFVRGPPIS